MRTVEALIPHVLQLVATRKGESPVVPSYLKWTQNLAAFTMAPLEQAFVFPSFLLAFRFARFTLGDSGLVLMPKAAPDRVPHEVFRMRCCRGCGCTAVFACPSHCSWVETDLCSECAKPAESLVAWTVYARPTDMPDLHVARMTLDGVPTENVLQHETLEGLRSQIPPGLHRIPRAASDPGSIVETWV